VERCLLQHPRFFPVDSIFLLFSAAFCAKVYLNAADRDQIALMTPVPGNADECPAGVVEHARAGTKTWLTKPHGGIAALALLTRPLPGIISWSLSYSVVRLLAW
jgi:hypothetical protein